MSGVPSFVFEVHGTIDLYEPLLADQSALVLWRITTGPIAFDYTAELIRILVQDLYNLLTGCKVVCEPVKCSNAFPMPATSTRFVELSGRITLVTASCSAKQGDQRHCRE